MKLGMNRSEYYAMSRDLLYVLRKTYTYTYTRFEWYYDGTPTYAYLDTKDPQIGCPVPESPRK